MILEYYFVRGDLPGRLELAHGTGFGISGLVILGSATASVIARVAQIIGGLLTRKQRPRNPGIH